MELVEFESTELSRGTFRAGGREVPYACSFERATYAGGAEVTAVSYVAQDAGHEASGRGSRPVMFVTNGGPGSSSLWLHLGLFGPRRVRMPDALHPPTLPPFELEDNPHCLLDVCDLVLVDPAGTGLSAPPDDGCTNEFLSVSGDALACALFVERWVDERSRSSSRVYFAGESYGTVRACALADELAGGPFSAAEREVAIALAGIAFLGTAISDATSPGSAPAVEPSVLALPSCAATFAYHHPENARSPREAYEEALQLCPAYLGALFQGRSQEAGARAALAGRLSSLLGLGEDELLRAGLRFDVDAFRSRVMDGCEVGAYDGRYVMAGPARPGTFPYPGATDPVADDAAMGAYGPVFVGGMRALREELGLGGGTYRAIDFAVNGRWGWDARRPAMASLENAMRRNPGMRLLFASGIFDLVCMPAQVRHLVDSSKLDPARTRVAEYEGGHMPYLGEQGATALERDLRALVGGTGAWEA